jgi:hypothetical protein
VRGGRAVFENREGAEAKESLACWSAIRSFRKEVSALSKSGQERAVMGDNDLSPPGENGGENGDENGKMVGKW